MVEVSVGVEIRELFPSALYGIICCEVQNSSFNSELWERIKALGKKSG